MMFANSLKLFGSNWTKVLKFLLYYVIIWGLCFVLLLPAFFEFREIVSESIRETNMLDNFNGVFSVSVGDSLFAIFQWTGMIFVSAFSANLGIAIYGVLVVFVFLPFLINIGKYTLYEMLYSYMTSKAKVGFFSALVKSLRKSLPFAICKTIYNMFFMALMLGLVYALGMINNPFFITYCLPIVMFVTLVVLFTLHQVSVSGWVSASIVFDCNVVLAYKKGLKAVKRHFWSILATTGLYFLLFWGLVILFGVYTLVPLTPIMTAILCVYNMVVFFASQGMRFYVNERNIMTPKKLEEVDNINKTAYIL